jgi:cytochrome c oxidase cbb3-type subunit 2
MKRFAIALFGMGLAVLLGGDPSPVLAQSANEELAQIREQLAQLQQQADRATGKQIYDVACAGCHGLKGDGKGPGGKAFAQHATDFTKGTYKLRSTSGDVPAPGDLERTIRVGMSGTEMVPFRHLLTERSTRAVAGYIRSFSPELSKPDAKPAEDEIVEIPEKRPFPRTAQTIEAGKALWEEHDCADCHGEDGQGTKDETDDWDFPVVMVSFQDGYYKSGPADQDLYRSIATGMKGTTMEGYLGDASAEDIWKMVDYIRSLARSERQGFIAKAFDFLLRTRPSGFDYSTY